MVRPVGLLILVLALSFGGLRSADDGPTPVEAGPPARPAIGPLDVVKSSVSRGLASVRSKRIGVDAGEARRAEIRRAADDLFDVEDMARRALGQRWKDLGPQEQDGFVRLFRDVLGQSFVAIVERYSDQDVAALSAEITGSRARVRSRITPDPGSEVSVEYRLAASGPGWAVYDVVLDGVSLVSSFRSQFNAILRTSSVTQLLERMRAGPSRNPPPRAAVGASSAGDPESSALGHMAVRLLLGAASSVRGR